jgi:hypothetical protein
MASGVNAALWRLPNALSTFIGALPNVHRIVALPFFVSNRILYATSIALFWFYFRKIKMPEEKKAV